jgi:hypothetical protein
MFAATAQAASQIRFRGPESAFTFEIPKIETKQQVAAADRLPSDNSLNVISGPSLIAAQWLATVERRIKESVPDQIMQAGEDDGWLNSEIARQAIRFFKATSDVLPAADPYIYTSMSGDLVVEFEGRHGKLTSVIGATSVLAFAVIDGNIVKTTMTLPFENVLRVRRELQRISDQLRSGEHGTVEA